MATQKSQLHSLDPSDRHPSKRLRSNLSAPASRVAFNPRYSDPTFVSTFNAAFTSADKFSDPTVHAQVDAHPFTHAILPNIVDPNFLQQVKAELLNEQYYHKSNDLYEFYQSEDLKITTSPCLSELRDAIYSPHFVSIMSRLTGLDLDPAKIDLSAHQYHHKGYLLCHDDDIKDVKNGTGRRIAFIIYLVDEDWNEDDGGTLDLFAADRDGYPTTIVRSLLPKWNQMAFFQLSATSHHQVAEVLTAGKIRLSISGWFHGPPKKPLVDTQILTITPSELPLSDFINPDYLSPTSLAKISSVFFAQSSIELQKFLRDDIYTQLLCEFDDNTVQWEPEPLGPPFVRRYRRLQTPPQSSALFRLQSFFTSTSFTSFLKSLTNLELAACAAETRRFAHGDYTLLHDHAIERGGLDVVFAIPRLPDERDRWDETWEGRMHYVDDAENLLTLVPAKNTLSLAMRDDESVQRFVKYINCGAEAREGRTAPERREISLVFYEETKAQKEERDGKKV